MPVRSPAVALALAFLSLTLIASAPALAADPTDGEQLFIYDMNRARSNPPAYAAEVGLGTLLDGVAARPPLAVNNLLVDSARFHAAEMANNDYFAHQSAVTGDWPNKMVRDAGYSLASWLNNTSNNVESLAAGTFYTPASAPDVLRALIEDLNIEPPDHRHHLLAMQPFYENFVEVGVGHAANGSAEYTNYWAIHTGFTDSSVTFITGVVYDDANGDGRYSYGEGLAGVTVTANPGGYSTTSNAAGGYSIAVPSNTYTVEATGGSFTGTASGQVTIGTANNAVDFISGEAVAEVAFGNQTFGGNVGDSGSGAACSVTPDGRSLSTPLLLLLFAFAFALRRLR